jgi:hypothetical protein
MNGLALLGDSATRSPGRGGGDCGLCRQRTLGIDTGGAVMMLYTAGTLALLLLGWIVARGVLRWLEARQ